MLVLSRSVRECVVINDNIFVEVTDLDDDKVYVTFYGATAGNAVLAVGESVQIQDAIEVKLISLRPSNKARIGFEAPTEMPIHRKETWDAIRQENNREP